MGFWVVYFALHGIGTGVVVQPNDGWITESRSRVAIPDSRMRVSIPESRDRVWIAKGKTE